LQLRALQLACHIMSVAVSNHLWARIRFRSQHMGHAADIVDITGEEFGGGGGSWCFSNSADHLFRSSVNEARYHLLHKKGTLRVNIEVFRWNVDISMQLGHE